MELCLGREGALSKALGLVGSGPADSTAWVSTFASTLDLDVLGKNFAKHAGFDALMDREEYNQFTAEQNITRSQAAALWHLLDHDGSGQINFHEFSEALAKLQEARAWMRHCPTCIYTNSCAYCLECNQNCEKCTENAFCPEHWRDHPARNVESEVVSENEKHDDKYRIGSVEYFRHQLIIRPLNWAYNSDVLNGLPVSYKAKVRQVLRDQQLRSQQAAQEAKAKYEARVAEANALIGLNRTDIPGLTDKAIVLGGVDPAVASRESTVRA